MAYTRKDYAGGAAETTITTGINGTDLSIPIASATGWPSGTNGPFVVVIDEGNASEEKVLCTSRTSTTLTVSSRGYDGTSGASHSSGATIAHCLSATDLDEANYTTAQTVGKVTTAGDLLVASGVNAFNRLAKGSNSTLLGVDSGGTLGYTTVTSAMIVDGTIAEGDLASSAVTEAKVATGAVTEAKIGTGAVTEAKIGAGAVTEAKIGTGAVTSAKILDGTIATADIADSAITVAKIGAQAVTEAKLHTSVAGDGLTGGNGTALAVGAGTGITVNANDVALNTSVVTTGAWTAFTPAFRRGTTAVTVTTECAYHRVGRLITARYYINPTASTGAGTPNVALPVNAITLTTSRYMVIGGGWGYFDGSLAAFDVHIDKNTSVAYAYFTVNGVTRAGPVAVDDYLVFTIHYEAAS